MKNKKTKKQLKKQEKREHRGTIAVHAKCVCGCCTVTMRFKDKSAAEKAFAKSGLANSATIVDDEGVVHEGIDTFYGFEA